MKQKNQYHGEDFYSDFFEELEARNSTGNLGTPEPPDSAALSQENVHKITEDILNPLPPEDIPPL